MIFKNIEKKMFPTVFAAVIFACARLSGAEAAVPLNPAVGENFSNPVGYDISELSFSWKLPPLRNGMRQTAYRIVVAESEGELDSAPVWDTGKVESSQNRNVRYGGDAPKSRQRLWWKVLFWDERGEASEWSKPQFFEAGLLNNSEWSAKWISSADKPFLPDGESGDMPKRVAPAYLKNVFEIFDKPVKSARLNLACLGACNVFINGRRVGDDFFGGGWTVFEKHVQSSVFEVENFLRTGANSFCAILADGWYSGRIGRIKWMAGGMQTPCKPEILLQLEITYADGTTQTVATSSDWKYTAGAITASDIYDGEVFDARREVPNWSSATADFSDWKNVSARDVDAAVKILPRRSPPVKKMMAMKALSVRDAGEGRFIFDFGQNMSGIVKIVAPVEAGTPVRLRFAEMLEADGSLYTKNYRGARSVDTFIPAVSTVSAQWEPRFTFHGFRYVEVSGLAKGVKPNLDMVEAFVLHTDMAQTGSFVCSYPKINRLQSNIQWGQRSNFLEVPTDCPQRDERLGWTGDAQVFSPTAAFNFDVSSFFSKWLFDVRNSQTPDGRIPDFVPSRGPSPMRMRPAWSDACVIVPWNVWLAYGDVKILSESFESMKKFVDFMSGDFDAHASDRTYGDWLQPFSKKTQGDTPVKLLSCAYLVRDADILAKTAAILGDKSAQKKYEKVASDFRKLFAERYLLPDGKIKSDTQTAYLCALCFNVVAPEIRAATERRFYEVLRREGFLLNTGFIGTPLILFGASMPEPMRLYSDSISGNPRGAFARLQLPYKILFSEKYPSWIFSINQGSTTMWERWNSFSHADGFGNAEMNSFNHYAYGAVGEWIYARFGGLACDENAAGFKNIIYAPVPPCDAKCFASVTRETPNGTAKSEWKISDGVMQWKVIVPPNSTGIVFFPTSKPESIRVEGRIPSPSSLEVSPLGTSMKLQSGTYEFLMRADSPSIRKR